MQVSFNNFIFVTVPEGCAHRTPLSIRLIAVRTMKLPSRVSHGQARSGIAARNKLSLPERESADERGAGFSVRKRVRKRQERQS